MKRSAVAVGFICICSAAIADEAPACNDPDVLKVIDENTIGKATQWALDFLARQPPGPGTPALMAEVQRWKQTIVNIRQQQYDEADNIRYCAAAETPITPSPDPNLVILLMASGMRDTACAHWIEYKIERPLDAPTQFSVSWKCH